MPPVVLELLRPRRIESVGEICDAAVALVCDAGWAADDVTRVALAIGEAVANAVEHGTPDAEASIRVRLDFDGRALTVHVDDGGPGPDPGLLDHASLPANPMATEGRGLYILQAVTNDVDLGADGVLRFVIRSGG